MEHYNEGEIINVGVGQDMSIAELVHLVARVVGLRADWSLIPATRTGPPGSSWTSAA